MKGNIKYLVSGILVTLMVYLFMTPMGALRLAVLRSGYPISAVTLMTREATVHDVGLAVLDHPSNTAIYTIIYHAPHEWATDADLENWMTIRYGIFYTAEYYGYL